jgi:hypothetical protein
MMTVITEMILTTVKTMSDKSVGNGDSDEGQDPGILVPEKKTPVIVWLHTIYCHTRPILQLQLSWKSGKSQLARCATKW